MDLKLQEERLHAFLNQRIDPSEEPEGPAERRRRQRRRRDARIALTKIANGTYTICSHCEEEISPTRHALVIEAILCVKCQTKSESGELSETDYSPQGMLIPQGA